MEILPFSGGLATGTAFGVVLYKVGASRYSRVMGMLTLRDTKVMKFTFVTISTASFIYGLADVFGLAEPLHLVPRILPFMGLAHVLGGLIFGATMGLVGFCPGTCMAKAGSGSGAKKYSALASILGLIAGVLTFVMIRDGLVASGVIAPFHRPITLHGLLGLPLGPVALVWGALFLLIALLVNRVTVEKVYEPARPRQGLMDLIRGEWSWLASGVIAGLLIVLATAQGKYVGFSGSLLALLGWIAHSVGHPLELVPTINEDIIWHAALILGAFLGGVLAMITGIPSAAATKEAFSKEFDLRAIATSFAGGTGLALGAMIGGGCTTGAYLSAWPTLSVGSLLMGGTFFASSMLVANFRYFSKKLDLKQAQLLGDRVYD